MHVSVQWEPQLRSLSTTYGVVRNVLVWVISFLGDHRHCGLDQNTEWITGLTSF